SSLLFFILSLMLLFLFSCVVHLPDLHSFPTRRSSDLCRFNLICFTTVPPTNPYFGTSGLKSTIVHISYSCFYPFVYFTYIHRNHSTDVYTNCSTVICLFWRSSCDAR